MQSKVKKKVRLTSIVVTSFFVVVFVIFGLLRLFALDTTILLGVILTEGLLAILPIFKDPVDRNGKQKWLIGKLNWAGYTVIFLFLLAVGLGGWKDSRERHQKVLEEQKLNSKIEEIKESSLINLQTLSIKDSTELQHTRTAIIDSVHFANSAQFNNMQHGVDSLLNQRLSPTDQRKILRELDKFPNVKCIIITSFQFTDSKLLAQVETFLATHKYEFSGTGMNFSTNYPPFRLVHVLSVDSASQCIDIEVGAW